MTSGHIVAKDRPRKRILLVDDEASIRLTLSPVLQEAGFDVHVAESVGDAIFEINSHQFDALISDLNIGEEGDGFLVTSAMRHIQPSCVIFILTGYPAFETALQAIRSQVDDYLVKPVEVQSLIGVVQERLSNQLPELPIAVQRVSGLLRQNVASIVESAIRGSRSTARQQKNPDKVTTEYLRAFLNGLADQIDCNGQLDRKALRAAAEYGKDRARKKGASGATLVREFGELESAVYNRLQRDLTSAEGVATLLGDLRILNKGFNLLLQEGLDAFEKAIGSPLR